MKYLRQLPGYKTTNNSSLSFFNFKGKMLKFSGKFRFKVWRAESEERAWWLDANDNNIPNDDFVKDSSPVATISSRRNSTQASNHSSCREQQQQVVRESPRLKHQNSGERPWWLSDDPENIPEGVEIIPPSPSSRTASISTNSASQNKAENVVTENSESRRFSRVTRVESGEKPWWLDEDSNVPEGVERLTPEKTEISQQQNMFSNDFDPLTIDDSVVETASSYQV